MSNDSSWIAATEALLIHERLIEEELHKAITEIALCSPDFAELAERQQIFSNLRRIERRLFPESALKHGIASGLEELIQDYSSDAAFTTSSMDSLKWLSNFQKVLLYKVMDHILIRLQECCIALDAVDIREQTDGVATIELICAKENITRLSINPVSEVWSMLEAQAQLIGAELKLSASEARIRIEYL